MNAFPPSFNRRNFPVSFGSNSDKDRRTKPTGFSFSSVIDCLVDGLTRVRDSQAAVSEEGPIEVPLREFQDTWTAPRWEKTMEKLTRLESQYPDVEIRVSEKKGWIFHKYTLACKGPETEVKNFEIALKELTGRLGEIIAGGNDPTDQAAWYMTNWSSS